MRKSLPPSPASSFLVAHTCLHFSFKQPLFVSTSKPPDHTTKARAAKISGAVINLRPWHMEAAHRQHVGPHLNLPHALAVPRFHHPAGGADQIYSTAGTPGTPARMTRLRMSRYATEEEARARAGEEARARAGEEARARAGAEEEARARAGAGEEARARAGEEA
eukprot:32598-Hanusia_phi.AAC.2